MHAVKCAIVDHQFGSEASRAVLAAANVQPLKGPTTAPEQGCVPLGQLPAGTVLVAEGGVTGIGECRAEELGRVGFVVAVADITALSILSRVQLLQMIHNYYR